MIREFSPQALSAGLLASFVGFASSFAVILRGLAAMGADPAQAASGLMALSIGMGLCGIVLSLWRRMPISVAWSTPGAALLATTPMAEGGFAGAVGAFLVCSALVIVCGLWRPLGRLVADIPTSLASAMLAGVLLGLCLAPVHAVAEAPVAGLSIVLTWAVVGRIRRLMAVPASVLVTLGWVVSAAPAGSIPLAALWPHPALVSPVFSLSAAIGIGVPLFIVTMASQNIPGMAILAVNGFRPAPGPLFTVTGAFSLLAAPFGGHAVNLAAITASICANEDAHSDPGRRYWAAVVAGVGYIVFGLLAGAATAFIGAARPILIEAAAGLALLGAFGGALMGAVSAAQDREAAVVTFLVTASGVSFGGVSGAFWGLVAGLGLRELIRRMPVR